MLNVLLVPSPYKNTILILLLVDNINAGTTMLLGKTPEEIVTAFDWFSGTVTAIAVGVPPPPPAPEPILDGKREVCDRLSPSGLTLQTLSTQPRMLGNTQQKSLSQLFHFQFPHFLTI